MKRIIIFMRKTEIRQEENLIKSITYHLLFMDSGAGG